MASPFLFGSYLLPIAYLVPTFIDNYLCLSGSYLLPICFLLPIWFQSASYLPPHFHTWVWKCGGHYHHISIYPPNTSTTFPPHWHHITTTFPQQTSTTFPPTYPPHFHTQYAPHQQIIMPICFLCASYLLPIK